MREQGIWPGTPQVPPGKPSAEGLTQLLEGSIALQAQGQLLCPLVTDLVVAEVQVLQGAVGCQAPTQGGKGIFPRAQVVPLQGEAVVRGLEVLSPVEHLTWGTQGLQRLLVQVSSGGRRLLSDSYPPTPRQQEWNTGNGAEGVDGLQDCVLWGQPEPEGPGRCRWVGAVPLNGLVLSKELSQSLSPCSSKVVALG